jgi:hypothetical protein
MAGGDLRLNNRKLKVKALPQNLPDFVEADITPLNMGNKLYVTQVYTRLQNHAPRQHSNLSSEDFSCSYESSSRSSKSSKAPVKGKKNNIFSIISKSISCKLVFDLSSALSRIISNSNFSEAQTLPPHRFVPIHFNLFLPKKAVKRIFITIGAILQPHPFENPTLHQNL